MAGSLYIVATPIGNLEDMTLRAIKTLREVEIVLAEDTRKTRILLQHYEIDKPILSYHQHSSDSKKAEILEKLMLGKNLALVADAGTPGISDPGNELIAFLLEREPDLKIVPIPGSSAVTTALSICGFNVVHFAFLGFVPKKRHQKFFKSLKEYQIPIVFFESPYRINKTIEEFTEFFGLERRVFVGIELTKVHERTLRGSLSEVQKKLEVEKKELGRTKGEVVLIVDSGQIAAPARLP